MCQLNRSKYLHVSTAEKVVCCVDRSVETESPHGGSLRWVEHHTVTDYVIRWKGQSQEDGQGECLHVAACLCWKMNRRTQCRVNLRVHEINGWWASFQLPRAFYWNERRVTYQNSLYKNFFLNFCFVYFYHRTVCTQLLIWYMPVIPGSNKHTYSTLEQCLP